MSDNQMVGTLFMSAVFLVAIVFVMRWLGAWMLRIDDVIKELKYIRDELKMLRNENRKPAEPTEKTKGTVKYLDGEK